MKGIVFIIKRFTLKVLDLSKEEDNFSILKGNEKDLLVLNTLGDLYCLQILEKIQKTPKSAMEINIETRIPISTVYRRIQILHDRGLLKVYGTISKDGKKYFLYKSKVKSIEAKYDGNLTVDIKFD